jgi:sulfite exporter TauE/SafE/copper chaperone CopZ/plastocyanin
MAKQKYFVQGMHCPACETFIEKTVAGMKGVKKATVSLADATLVIEADSPDELPSLFRLDQQFKKDGYTFHKQMNKTSNKMSAGQVATVLLIFLAIVAAFAFFSNSQLLEGFYVNSGSNLWAFFLFGVAAGLSSCAALVGGMLLSVQETWLPGGNTQSGKAALPFILFNGSRLAVFALLGGLLGLLGGLFRISFTVSVSLTITIALFMFVIGMQMIGVKIFQKIKLSQAGKLVSSITGSNKLGRTWMPIVFGAVTFFVPCGFTLIAQSQALSSGSFAQGLGIMTAFALGTLPMLAVISYSSLRFYRNPRFANPFRLLAGLLVVFFALVTLNNQFRLLRLPDSQSSQTAAALPLDIRTGALALGKEPTAAIQDQAAIPAGAQVIRMEAKGFAYFPETITIQAGVPTRFEITDNGSTGCARAVYAKGLYPDVIVLNPGLNVVEFTAPAPGTYQISCSMGMVDPVTVIVE